MLSEKVARLLLERGRITPRQLEEAERTRSFFGGMAESYLLRLGYIDEATLGDALTEVSGVPYASVDRLRRIPLDVVSSIAPEVARRLAAVPFRLEERKLRVAMLNPKDPRAIAEIQTLTGWQIEPWITSEHRLDQALERHYRVRREGLPRISLAVPGSAERIVPREVDPPPPPPPAAPALGLDGRPLDAHVDFDDHLFYPAHGDRNAPPSEPDAAPATPPVPVAPPEPPPAPRVSTPETPREAPSLDPMAGLARALSRAPDRESAGSALLDFCATRASRGAIFAVGRDGIRGLAGRGPGFDDDRVRKVVLPPGGSTVLDAALRSRDFFFGVVPALPPNRDLYTVLGGRLPTMALVVPILVKERLVALLYLDDEERPMTRPDIPLMRRVAAKAGLAFEILLLRGKLKAL